MLSNNAYGSAGVAQYGTGVGFDWINLGGNVLQPVSQEVTNDPYDGTMRVFRFRGTVLSVNYAAAQALANGWQSRIETNGTPWPELIVTQPDPGSSEYTIVWEFDIEFKQQDIWVNLGILNYLQATAGLSTSEILDLRHSFNGYLEQNTKYSAVAAMTDPSEDLLYSSAEMAIYQLLSMGCQYIEVAQPVLSRKRTYDIAYTGPAMSTLNTQTIWSTSALVSAFSIPTATADQIEADPITTPVSNFAYGWKQRKNRRTIIPAKNKITEELDWVWDQWSTIGYNYIP